MKPASALNTVPSCSVRQKLASEFAISARQFAEAATLLAQSSSRLDFERLSGAAQQAQERAERARVAFEEHVREHGC
jgi:hypothetical protein